jgi:transcriptional antiterminator RfaH
MSYWAVARLEHHREQLALHCLALAGYTVYLPRLRQHRVSHGRRIETTPALFPGYAFLLVELQWHTARWAPGVARIVLDGAAPARVPDQVIAEIRGRERGGLIELPRPPKYRLGDRVRVLHGPFIGLVGLYAGMKPRERVEVLLGDPGRRPARHAGGRCGRGCLEGPALPLGSPLAGYFVTPLPLPSRAPLPGP